MGLSQSELARRVWGETEDNRGYKVARNRDRISAYEKGSAQPTRENLEAIAEVLGVPPEELAPEAKFNRAEPAVAMTMLEGEPNRVHLKINTITSLALAAKVIALLSENPANDND